MKKTLFIAVCCVIITLLSVALASVVSVWNDEGKAYEARIAELEQANKVSRIDSDKFMPQRFVLSEKMRCKGVSEGFFTETPSEQTEVEFELKEVKREYASMTLRGDEFPLKKIGETDRFVFYSSSAQDGYVGSFSLNKLTGEVRASMVYADDNSHYVTKAYCGL